jgi:hypothetical protein
MWSSKRSVLLAPVPGIPESLLAHARVRRRMSAGPTGSDIFSKPSRMRATQGTKSTLNGAAVTSTLLLSISLRRTGRSRRERGAESATRNIGNGIRPASRNDAATRAPPVQASPGSRKTLCHKAIRHLLEATKEAARKRRRRLGAANASALPPSRTKPSATFYSASKR